MLHVVAPLCLSNEICQLLAELYSSNICSHLFLGCLSAASLLQKNCRWLHNLVPSISLYKDAHRTRHGSTWADVTHSWATSLDSVENLLRTTISPRMFTLRLLLRDLSWQCPPVKQLVDTSLQKQGFASGWSLLRSCVFVWSVLGAALSAFQPGLGSSCGLDTWT